MLAVREGAHERDEAREDSTELQTDREGRAYRALCAFGSWLRAGLVLRHWPLLQLRDRLGLAERGAGLRGK